MRWLVGLAGLGLAALPHAAWACYTATVREPTPFKGNNGEVVKLSDGSIWEVKYEYEYLYEYRPEVVICPAQGKLHVSGKSLNVVNLAPPRAPTPGGSAASAGVIETRIDGDFEGWDGETIFKLANGQIWQQAAYAYHYHYAYSPAVLIYSSGGTAKMKVEGVSETIAVRRLR